MNVVNSVEEKKVFEHAFWMITGKRGRGKTVLMEKTLQHACVEDVTDVIWLSGNETTPSISVAGGISVSLRTNATLETFTNVVDNCMIVIREQQNAENRHRLFNEPLDSPFPTPIHKYLIVLDDYVSIQTHPRCLQFLRECVVPNLRVWVSQSSPMYTHESYRAFSLMSFLYDPIARSQHDIFQKCILLPGELRQNNAHFLQLFSQQLSSLSLGKSLCFSRQHDCQYFFYEPRQLIENVNATMTTQVLLSPRQEIHDIINGENSSEDDDGMFGPSPNASWFPMFFDAPPDRSVMQSPVTQSYQHRFISNWLHRIVTENHVECDDEPVDPLNKTLQPCSVCMHSYNDTNRRIVALNCGHVLCCTCLNEIHSNHETRKCPSCREIYWHATLLFI